MKLFLNIKEKLSDEAISYFFNFVRNAIIEQTKTELSGFDKKQNVDNAVILFIKSNIKATNPIITALVNILIEYIPVLTQCIYENLKKYVDGLTEG